MFTWNELAVLATVFSGYTAGFIWLTRQFSIINASVYKTKDELKNVFLDKLEYHERHDDVRFDNVRKDIYQLGLRMAANTGKINGGSQEDHRPI